MFKYKIDILSDLKQAGYNTNRIRQENLLSQSTLQKFREQNTKLTLENLGVVCKLLNCQLSDILEYVPDEITNENSMNEGGEENGQ